MNATTTQGESEAMQIGRDDYKAWEELDLVLDDFATRKLACPFPQGSEDAGEWQEGWNRERDGK